MTSVSFFYLRVSLSYNTSKIPTANDPLEPLGDFDGPGSLQSILLCHVMSLFFSLGRLLRLHTSSQKRSEWS